ncbi:MAG: LEA type 2 family protein [Cyclobacteriaceae bacterium]
MKCVQICFIAIAILLSGCDFVEEVEFRQISNVRISMDGPKVSADITLFNPNNFSLNLKRSEIDISFDGKSLGRIDQQHQIAINKKSEFTVPLEVQVSLKDLGFGNAIMGILGGKKYPLRFQGKIYGQVKGLPVSVNVDHTEEVRIGK